VTTEAPQIDEGLSVLESLAGMNLDLGTLDLAALDKALDEKTEAAMQMRSLDLLTQFSTSEDVGQKSLATLATHFGGAAELEADGIHDEATARRFVPRAPARRAGRARARDGPGCREGRLRAAAAHRRRAPLGKGGPAGGERRTGERAQGPARRAALEGHRARARTDAALRASRSPKAAKPFQKRALSSARHLADWAEILEGLGEFVEPPAALIERSAKENVVRALQAASVMQQAFRTTPAEREWSYDADDDEPRMSRRKKKWTCGTLCSMRGLVH
jgi:hypothetical protein